MFAAPKFPTSAELILIDDFPFFIFSANFFTAESVSRISLSIFFNSTSALNLASFRSLISFQSLSKVDPSPSTLFFKASISLCFIDSSACDLIYPSQASLSIGLPFFAFIASILVSNSLILLSTSLVFLSSAI